MMPRVIRRTMVLNTPHIPLGSSLEDALGILRGLGRVVREDSDGERHYRVKRAPFAIAIYPKGETVGSVWYDDPTGRETSAGRSQKVRAYLKRYGLLKNWERRLDNGWMCYWFNDTDGVQMVYGIHKDVIRFNQYNKRA